MSDYVPVSVWFKILLFLPVKTLLQFTSVCKAWRSLITSSAFISAHLSASRRRPLLLTRTPNTNNNPQAFSLLSDPDPSPLSRDFLCPFPLNDPDVSFRVVGSVHGLVCLSDDLIGYTYTVIVWNPSIQSSVHLPKPASTYDAVGPYHFALGFGFDSGRNDYKVVRVVYLQGWTDQPQVPPLVEVYSLRELSWRSVSADAVEYCITEIMWSQCFLHGAVHWVASKRTNTGFETVILLFDLENEVFKKMKLPESLAGLCPLRLSVSVVGGLLAVLDRHFQQENLVPFKVGDDSNNPCKMDIWVKKGYGKGGSWAKIFTVDRKWDIGLALHLRRIGEEVQMETGGAESTKLECDLDDLQLAAAYNVFHFNTNAFFAFTYPESLVLLHKENGADAFQVSKDQEWIESYPEGQSGGAYHLTPEKEKHISIALQMSTTHAVVTNVLRGS